MTARRRRGTIALSILVIVGALVYARCDRARERDRAPSSGTAPPRAQQQELVLAAPHDPPAGVPSGAPAPVVIDEITVEKPSVCEGEENLVTVRAHTRDHAEDAYLHAVIAGSPGTSVPVTTFRAKDGTIAPRNIVVFGRGDEPAVAPLPAFEVRDCMADRRLLIDYKLRANTEAEFDFQAKVAELAANTPFRAARWHWDFGDGTSADTTDPFAVHGFEDRTQDQTLYAMNVITVTAVDDRGAAISGRTTFVLQNAAYANLVYAGVVSLQARLTPRFPVIGDDGVVRQRVRLWHQRREPVRIDAITERRNFKDGRDPVAHTIAVSSLLSSPYIPRSGVDVQVALDTTREPDLYSIDYELTGVSAEGIPVHGVFPVMAPPDLPTKEHHDTIRDPALVARVVRARELLNKPFVTDEDLWELERRGAFANLPALGATAPASDHAPTYADLPQHTSRPGEPEPNAPLPNVDTMPVWGAPAPTH